MRTVLGGLIAAGALTGMLACGFADPPGEKGEKGDKGGRGQRDGKGKGGQRDGGRGEGRDGPGFHLIPPFVREELNLTAEQERKIAELEKEVQKKLNAILTPEEQKKMRDARPPQGGPGGDGPPQGGPDGQRRPGGDRGGNRPDRPQRPDGAGDPPPPPNDRDDAPPMAPRGPAEFRSAVEEMQLGGDQLDKVHGAMKAFHESMQRHHAAEQAAMMAMLKDVLTPEQLEKLNKAMAKPRGPRPE